MSREEKNIDRIFRERLRNFDADPPVEVWEGIREKLYLDRRRKTIFWITRVAAGITILAALSLTYFIGRNSYRNNQISGNKELKSEEKLSEEKLPAGEQAENPVAAEALSGMQSADSKSDQKVINQKIENELNTEYIGYSPFKDNEVRAEVQGVPESDQQEVMNSLIGRSIFQLEYNYPGTGLMISSSESPGEQSEKNIIIEDNLPEDLYALNIPEEEENRESRWTVGTEISPLYSYRNIETSSEAMALADDLNQSESGTLAYSGGVNVNFSPLRRLSVQSGVYYSRYGVNVDNAYFIEDATADAGSGNRLYSIDYSSGKIDIGENAMADYITNIGDHKFYNNGNAVLDPYTSEVNSGDIVQNFEYIEVPLILRYRVIDRKIGFNFLGGLSTNLLVGSNTYYNSGGDREKIGETTELNPVNYSSIVGLGLDYSVSKHLYISLEPTFRYYLNSINQSSIIRSYPYSIGVFTGLKYSF